jgi:hypothetical protein
MYSFVEETGGLYGSLKEMLNDDIPPVEEIIFGTERGDVAQLVSVTDAGKTTLVLNTCLRIAAGEMCLPLAPDVPRPRRVYYMDFEATRPKLRDYLLRMRGNFSPESWELVEENFVPFCDATLDYEPLNLSNRRHMALIKKETAAADLIVIDTLSAAFDLADENSNAEVKKEIMKPLKRLALETNAAVLFCHHAGKPGEGANAELAYSGRGASTFGGLSRAVFALTKNRVKGSNYVTLQCAKAKRDKFDPVLLYLNRELAWFEVCAERPALEQPFTVQEFVEFVDSKGEVSRKEYLKHFKDRASEETIDKRKDQALNDGLVDPAGRGRVRSKKPTSSVN